MSVLDDNPSCFHKSKREDGEGVLAYCEKYNKESVELAGLCELYFFYPLGSHVCCLSCYGVIALDIGCTDSEDLEKQLPVTYGFYWGFSL